MILVRDEVFTNYRVCVGAFCTAESATKWIADNARVGETPFVRKIDDVYFVQYGAFTEYDNAINYCKKLNLYGFPVLIIGKEI